MVKWWPGARGPIEMAFELQAVGDVVRSMKMKMPHLSFFFHRTIGYIALFALTSSLVHRSPHVADFYIRPHIISSFCFFHINMRKVEFHMST